MSGEGTTERSLEEEVARGRVRREALELLSLLGHPDARRALGRLPLVLEQAPPARWLDDGDPSASAEGWCAIATWLAPFGRPLAVEASTVVVELVLEALRDHEEPAPAAQVGLHTGPGGYLHVTPEVARELFPVLSHMERATRAARRTLREPSASYDAGWPSLLTTRKSVRLCAELAELDWRAVWAARWLVACATGPEVEAPAAFACVATYADAALQDAARVRRRLSEALAARLLAPGRGAPSVADD